VPTRSRLPKSDPTPANSPAQSNNAPIAASTNPGNATESSKTDKVRWTDLEAIIPIIGFSLQLLISAVGFSLVFWQIRLLNQGIQGDTHSKLYDHYLKVNDLLSKKPELRPYFYYDYKLKDDSPGHATVLAEIEMMSEIILGLLEHAAVQRDNLPADSWEHCWYAYTVERFKRSPELQRFFQDNHQWYAGSFCEVIQKEFPELFEHSQPESVKEKVDEGKPTPQTPEVPNQ